MRAGLTTLQAEVLTFIETAIAATGASPSFEEIGAALGLRSKSSVHRVLEALEKRGRIVRLPHQARSIELVGAPKAPVPTDDDVLAFLRERITRLEADNAALKGQAHVLRRELDGLRRTVTP